MRFFLFSFIVLSCLAVFGYIFVIWREMESVRQFHLNCTQEVKKGGYLKVNFAFVTSQHRNDSLSKEALWIPSLDWLHENYGPVPKVVYRRSGERFSSEKRWLPNKGREVLPYLTYLTEHYDTLPKFVVFIHGHESSSHCEPMMHILRGLRWENIHFANLNWLGEEGFYTTLEASSPPSNSTFKWVKLFWADMFRESGRVPERISFHAHSQFVVSRERIRSRKKQFYEKLHTWARDTNYGDQHISAFFQATWHFIFGEEADMPKQERCHFTTSPLCPT